MKGRKMTVVMVLVLGLTLVAAPATVMAVGTPYISIDDGTDTIFVTSSGGHVVDGAGQAIPVAQQESATAPGSVDWVFSFTSGGILPTHFGFNFFEPNSNILSDTLEITLTPLTGGLTLDTYGHIHFESDSTEGGAISPLIGTTDFLVFPIFEDGTFQHFTVSGPVDIDVRSDVEAVPEPGILILLGISMASIVGLKRRWKD